MGRHDWGGQLKWSGTPLLPLPGGQEPLEFNEGDVGIPGGIQVRGPGLFQQEWVSSAGRSVAAFPIHGGTPIYGYKWLVDSGKSHLEMDDDWLCFLRFEPFLFSKPCEGKPLQSIQRNVRLNSGYPQETLRIETWKIHENPAPIWWRWIKYSSQTYIYIYITYHIYRWYFRIYILTYFNHPPWERP